MTNDLTLRGLDDDEQGMIVGWLGKLLIGFVLVAVVVFDGGSILVNFFTLDSTANEIAVKLTTDIDVNAVRQTVLEEQADLLAKEAGARVLEVRVEANVVFVKLRRRADTLVVGRIGPIEDWARATAEGQSGTG